MSLDSVRRQLASDAQTTSAESRSDSHSRGDVQTTPAESRPYPRYCRESPVDSAEVVCIRCESGGYGVDSAEVVCSEKSGSDVYRRVSQRDIRLAKSWPRPQFQQKSGSASLPSTRENCTHARAHTRARAPVPPSAVGRYPHLPHLPRGERRSRGERRRLVRCRCADCPRWKALMQGRWRDKRPLEDGSGNCELGILWWHGPHAEQVFYLPGFYPPQSWHWCSHYTGPKTSDDVWVI